MTPGDLKAVLIANVVFSVICWLFLRSLGAVGFRLLGILAGVLAIISSVNLVFPQNQYLGVIGLLGFLTWFFRETYRKLELELSRRQSIALFILAGLAILVRLTLIFEIPFPVFYPDSLSYLSYVNQFQTGNFLYSDGYRTPGYPYFLFCLFNVFGGSPIVPLLFQQLLGPLVALPFLKAVQLRVRSINFALLFYFILAAQPESLLWGNALLTDALSYCAVLLLSAYLLRGNIFAAVFTAGLLPLIKPNLVYALPLLATYIFLLFVVSIEEIKPKIKRLGVSLLLLCTPTLLFSAVNFKTHGSFSISTMGGSNFFWTVANFIDFESTENSEVKASIYEKVRQLNAKLGSSDIDKLNYVAWEKDGLTETINSISPGNHRLFKQLAIEGVLAHPLTWAHRLYAEIRQSFRYRLGVGYSEVYYKSGLQPLDQKHMHPVIPQGKFDPQKANFFGAVIFLDTIIALGSWMSWILPLQIFSLLTLPLLLLCGPKNTQSVLVAGLLFALQMSHFLIHVIANWSNGRYIMVALPYLFAYVAVGFSILRNWLPSLSVSQMKKLITAYLFISLGGVLPVMLIGLLSDGWLLLLEKPVLGFSLDRHLRQIREGLAFLYISAFYASVLVVSVLYAYRHKVGKPLNLAA